MKILKIILLILAVCAAGFWFSALLPGRAAAPPLTSSPVSDSVRSLAVSVSPSAPIPAEPSVMPVIQGKIPLFTGGEVADILWTNRTPAALRVRRIFPDVKMMAPEPVLKKGDHIELALFDDEVLDAEISNVTRYPNGAVGLTAHLRNGREGTLFLSYCDGQMRASVQVLGGNDFYVKYNPKTGAHYAVEVDHKNSVVLEGAEPRIPPANDAPADVPVSPVAAESAALADAPAGSTIVDVMIVYTPAARTVEGGVSGMNNNIALAMQKANEAHTNSNTQVYLNLVHSAEVAYTEVDADTDLDNLTFTGGTNSAMDDVQTWRDQYGADFVCLFESTEEVGGMGWLLSNTNGRPDYAFCLARVQQSDWSYTVVHEWGHNMGCSHSKTQTYQPWTGKLYSYSAGWQWDDSLAASIYPYTRRGYCSVMTYEDFDDDGTKDYIRVGYFSNPDINYTGNGVNATGHAADGDNARTIRTMKTVLAGYRAPQVPIPSVTLSVAGSPMAEAGGVARVTATLSSAYTLPVTVKLAFSGTATWPNDYTRSGTNIVIATGSTTSSITLTAVQDKVYEGDETIVVDVSSVVNATESDVQQVTAVITDDDSYLNVDPPSGLLFAGLTGGVSTPSNQVFMLTNSGIGSLSWRAARASNWANLSATNGTLAEGSSTNVTVSVNIGALTNGTYSNAITFSNVTSGASLVRAVSLTVLPDIYFFPLDTDPGWARSGEWAFGHPTGQGGVAFGFPDPSDGYTAVNVFGVNLNGDYLAVPGDPYYLTAGPLNFSNYTNVSLYFQRWLNTDMQGFADATVEVSGNGTTWTPIYAGTNALTLSTNWTRCQYDISGVADRRSAVYVRWGYRVYHNQYALSGWNIDDIGFLGTLAPPGSADRDGDGLPDSWELQYFGGDTNANPNAFAANGVNTVLETYVAGLNPTNAASFFKVSSFALPVASNGGFVVRWSAVTGRVYGVHWTTNLKNSFQPLATNIVWPRASYTDTVHGAESRNFYKIKVQLAP